MFHRTPPLLELRLPSKIRMGKKFHYLNLNQYRNWNFRVASQLKKLFSALMIPCLRGIHPIEGPLEVKYTYFSKTKKKIDLTNACSVVDKFFLDSLVENKIIQDDNVSVIPSIQYEYGGVDGEESYSLVQVYGYV